MQTSKHINQWKICNRILCVHVLLLNCIVASVSMKLSIFFNSYKFFWILFVCFAWWLVFLNTFRHWGWFDIIYCVFLEWTLQEIVHILRSCQILKKAPIKILQLSKRYLGITDLFILSLFVTYKWRYVRSKSQGVVSK